MSRERWIREKYIVSKYPHITPAGLDSPLSPVFQVDQESSPNFEDESGNMVLKTADHFTRVFRTGDEPKYFPFAVLPHPNPEFVGSTVLMANLKPDDITGEIVIVKTAKSPGKILQEAEIMQIARHPNIVNLLDIAVMDRKPCIVMEWLPGGDLEEQIEEDIHFISDLADAFDQSAAAIDRVNKLGYIYADAKPENIRFDRKGIVKLIDFGNCSKIDRTDGSAPNSLLVTRKYAPPEQMDMLGGLRLYLQSDVFSLGATLYEMLTGDQGSQADVERRAFTEGRKELSLLKDYREALNPTQVERLTEVLRKALDPDYQARQPNVMVLNQEVQAILAS